MSKQTAVDKFHDAVNDMIARRRPMTSNEVAKIWLECKEIEKEQIMKTARQCHFEGVRQSAKNSEEYLQYGEQYYNETYDNDKQ
jgi:hypothetical protein